MGKQLKEAISDKGYCLDTLWAGKYREYYEIIDSTNNRGKQLGMQFGMHGTLVVADMQTGGKGRRGRTWESEVGDSILMSLVLQPDIIPKNASMLTLVNALAVRDAIEKVAQLQTSIKWPNDIVIDGKKVGGILTEMSTENNKVRYIVIGTGINVNNQTFSKEIRSMATSLYAITKKRISREQLIVQYLQCFEFYYEIFMKTQDLTFLQKEYEMYLISIGKEVCILDGINDKTVGVCQGITKEGDLIVKMPDGTVKNVLSGEVSVRGVYGYV